MTTSEATSPRATSASSSTRRRPRSDMSGRREPEAVANPPDGVDQGRSQPVKLFAQIAHVGLDHIAIPPKVVLPDPVQDLGFRQYPAGIQQEVAKETELGVGEVNRRPSAPYLEGVFVQGKVGEGQPVGVTAIVVRVESADGVTGEIPIPKPA